MSLEEKNKYNQEAEIDKERYQKEIEKYVKFFLFYINNFKD